MNFDKKLRVPKFKMDLESHPRRDRHLPASTSLQALVVALQEWQQQDIRTAKHLDYEKSDMPERLFQFFFFENKAIRSAPKHGAQFAFSEKSPNLHSAGAELYHHIVAMIRNFQLLGKFNPPVPL